MNCHFCGLNLIPSGYSPTAMRCPNTKCIDYGFAIKEPMTELIHARDTAIAERDQLIKVVDALAHGIEAFRDFGCAKHGTHYDVMMKCYEAYSLLPHVQAKKGKK